MKVPLLQKRLQPNVIPLLHNSYFFTSSFATNSFSTKNLAHTVQFYVFLAQKMRIISECLAYTRNKRLQLKRLIAL